MVADADSFHVFVRDHELVVVMLFAEGDADSELVTSAVSCQVLDAVAPDLDMLESSVYDKVADRDALFRDSEMDPPRPGPPFERDHVAVRTTV